MFSKTTTESRRFTEISVDSPCISVSSVTPWWLLVFLKSLPLVFVLMHACTGSLRAEEIDRLLVAVNRKVVTEGDLVLARNLNALLELGRNVAQHSRDEELNRLIDLELLRQELGHFSVTQAEESEVEQKMEELRVTYAEIGGLPALLGRLGLQETELRAYIALLISSQKFIHFRFQPFVSISPEQKLAYYQQELVPQLQKSPGARIPTLEEVSAQIEEILIEREVNSAMERWLRDIRGHSRIEYFTRTAATQGGASR